MSELKDADETSKLILKIDSPTGVDTQGSSTAKSTIDLLGEKSPV